MYAAVVGNGVCVRVRAWGRVGVLSSTDGERYTQTLAEATLEVRQQARARASGSSSQVNERALAPGVPHKSAGPSGSPLRHSRFLLLAAWGCSRELLGAPPMILGAPAMLPGAPP